MIQNMITLSRISHQYQNQDGTVAYILDDLTCSIEEGEFVSFVGKSGCGKTTLVKIIAGYVKPSNGDVLIDNNIIITPSHNRIVVHQEDDVFDWLTVKDNMSLVCKDGQTINKLLVLGQLDKYKNRYPFELSGGMKKRLSLVRALAANPQILLLDEPFASLDYFTKETLHIELSKLLWKTKKTILLVTHDIDEAIFLSDRVIVLEGQPASIKKVFSIPFSRPRDLKIYDDAMFVKLRSEIRDCY